MDRINYGKVIDHFADELGKDKVIMGIDGMTYIFNCKDKAKLDYNFGSYFFEKIKCYPQNSNIQGLGDYKGFTVELHFEGVKQHGNIIDVIISNDEYGGVKFGNFYINKSCQKFSIYGMGFLMCKKYKIDPSGFTQFVFNFFSQSIKKYRVSSLDYAIDLIGVSVDDLISKLKYYNRGLLGQRKGSVWLGQNGRTETRHIGSRNTKCAWVRVYDKYLDIKKTKKARYYLDTMYSNPTTRIEGVFGTDFCGSMPLSVILNKVKTWFGVSNSYIGNFYLRDRYNPELIADVEKYKSRRSNMTVKLMNNDVDLEDKTKEINKRQAKYSLDIYKNKKYK